MVVARFDFWAAFGVIAQFVFGARFLVQWIASEKAERSVIPVGFWFLSIGGGLMTLVYGFARRDLVIILGQAFSIFIYIRNLMLIAGSEAAQGARTPVGRCRLGPAEGQRRVRATAASHEIGSGRLRVRFPQARETCIEIGLEVVQILQPDMEPQGVAAGIPGRCRAVGRAVERNDEALETTPGIAHPEQLEAVEHGGERPVGTGLAERSRTGPRSP